MLERRAPLTSSRELHEDVELIIGGLSRPEIRDGLPRRQLLNSFVVLFDLEAAKRILGGSVEIYVDLSRCGKVGHNVDAGL